MKRDTVDSRYNIIIFYNRQQFEMDHIYNHLKFTRYNVFYDTTDINLGTISSVITRVGCIITPQLQLVQNTINFRKIQKNSFLVRNSPTKSYFHNITHESLFLNYSGSLIEFQYFDP